MSCREGCERSRTAPSYPPPGGPSLSNASSPFSTSRTKPASLSSGSCATTLHWVSTHARWSSKDWSSTRRTIGERCRKPSPRTSARLRRSSFRPLACTRSGCPTTTSSSLIFPIFPVRYLSFVPRETLLTPRIPRLAFPLRQPKLGDRHLPPPRLAQLFSLHSPSHSRGQHLEPDEKAGREGPKERFLTPSPSSSPPSPPSSPSTSRTSTTFPPPTSSSPSRLSSPSSSTSNYTFTTRHAIRAATPRISGSGTSFSPSATRSTI